MRADIVGTSVHKLTERWFTCTPVPFGGGADFFARDSGLLSRGFRAIGADSMAVMPGERKPEDEADLIRTDYANLESADWWRAHKLNGVVLYAWGAPRYRHVARAIRESGAVLILNQDSSGVISPLVGLRPWLNEQWVIHGGATTFQTFSRAVAGILKGCTVGLMRTDPLRAAHLRHGDFIAALYPGAAGYLKKICRIYGGDSLAKRVVVLPHAVSPAMAFPAISHKKTNRIITIGRWDDLIQKRPGFLMETLGLLLSTDAEAVISVIGGGHGVFGKWLSELPAEKSARVTIHGKLPHHQLAGMLNDAAIFYCPSAYESFNIAAAEALCCGCSVVAADTPTMASFRWFTGAGSGTLAALDNPDSHRHALSEELAHWQSGRRDPVKISTQWTARLHADRVAAQILEMTHNNL